jgi:hypothetical protein
MIYPTTYNRKVETKSRTGKRPKDAVVTGGDERSGAAPDEIGTGDEEVEDVEMEEEEEEEEEGNDPPTRLTHSLRVERILVTVEADIIPCVVRALTHPIAEVRAGRMLQCHGASPGRMNGPVRLVPDSRTRYTGGRLRLWLGADGALQLTYEQVRPSASHELVARVSPERAEKFRAEAARERKRCAAGYTAATAAASAEEIGSKLGRTEVGHPLTGDASGRGFYLTLGSGAGQRKYFYWLQHPDVEEAGEALMELKAALRDPPTLSSLTGVCDDQLSALALAAPALLHAFTAASGAGGSSALLYPLDLPMGLSLGGVVAGVAESSRAANILQEAALTAAKRALAAVGAEGIGGVDGGGGSGGKGGRASLIPGGKPRQSRKDKTKIDKRVALSRPGAHLRLGALSGTTVEGCSAEKRAVSESPPALTPRSGDCCDGGGSGRSRAQVLAALGILPVPVPPAVSVGSTHTTTTATTAGTAAHTAAGAGSATATATVADAAATDAATRTHPHPTHTSGRVTGGRLVGRPPPRGVAVTAANIGDLFAACYVGDSEPSDRDPEPPDP